jgi:hypothetical protein
VNPGPVSYAVGDFDVLVAGFPLALGGSLQVQTTQGPTAEVFLLRSPAE